MIKDPSFVSLTDPNTCWRDETAKSIGYFAKSDVVRLDAAIIKEIKRQAQETGENVRLSLHQSPDDGFHEMIIYQHRDKYYRPKKHINKAKSFHMIEGEMAVFAFSDGGELIDSCILDGKSTIAYRVAANVFHTDVPLTDYVIHHESTLGPFMGDNDRVFAPWSPDGSDKKAYLTYRDELVAAVNKD
jgi:cupin fold WbuC family metalloprotein